MKLSGWVILLYFLLTINFGITISLMDFAGRGERFTADDGRALEKRIEALEHEAKSTL